MVTLLKKQCKLEYFYCLFISIYCLSKGLNPLPKKNIVLNDRSAETGEIASVFCLTVMITFGGSAISLVGDTDGGVWTTRRKT